MSPLSNSEELKFRNAELYLSLWLDRRMRNIRVIDFRAGNFAAKRLFIDSVARREGAEKIFTVVERDEVRSWVKVGFRRQAVIPGFFRRSDGYLCDLESLPWSKGTFDRGGEEKRAVDLVASASARAETELAQRCTVVDVTVEPLLRGRRACDLAWASGQAQSSLLGFGPGNPRQYVAGRARGLQPLWCLVEQQEYYKQAIVQFLTSPDEGRQHMDLALTTTMAVMRALQGAGFAAVLAIVPANGVSLATAMAAAGMRYCGFVPGFFGLLDGDRQSALLYAHKWVSRDDDASHA